MTIDSPSEILAHFPAQYSAKHIDRLDRSEGFSGAQIFRVETAAGVFALRAWPKESLPPLRIKGLHRLLAHAYSLGVRQVSVPVVSSDGGTLVLSQGHFCQLEPWMSGVADFHSNRSERKLAAAMDCLASFHRAAASYAANDGSSRWFVTKADAVSPAVVERLDRLREWQGKLSHQLEDALSACVHDALLEPARECLRLFRRAAPQVADELATAARLKLQLQPCLRDVWHDHLLFTDEQVTGLIDASACRSDHVAVDLSRLLGSLVGDDFYAWSRALEFYSRHRPLADYELALVRALDRSGVLLSPLTWLERRYLRNQQFRQPDRIVDRLGRFLTRLRTLS